jgi:hypothetical protein
MENQVVKCECCGHVKHKKQLSQEEKEKKREYLRKYYLDKMKPLREPKVRDKMARLYTPEYKKEYNHKKYLEYKEKRNNEKNNK